MGEIKLTRRELLTRTLVGTGAVLFGTAFSKGGEFSLSSETPNMKLLRGELKDLLDCPVDYKYYQLGDLKKGSTTKQIDAPFMVIDTGDSVEEFKRIQGILNGSFNYAVEWNRDNGVDDKNPDTNDLSVMTSEQLRRFLEDVPWSLDRPGTKPNLKSPDVIRVMVDGKKEGDKVKTKYLVLIEAGSLNFYPVGLVSDGGTSTTTDQVLPIDAAIRVKPDPAYKK